MFSCGHFSLESVALVLFTILLLWGSSKCIDAFKTRRKYEENRHKRRKHCRDAFEDLKNKLKEDGTDEFVCGFDASTLKQKIQNKELTPLQILKAFQRKALQVHDKTNCLTEPIPEAEDFLKHANKSGILYGIPISLKDDVKIKGYNTSYGLSKYITDITKEDCAIVKNLKRNGAVPFVRTNIPQFEFSFEPGNPIYGTVSNPHDITKIPGGSSSGEGALVGGGGSVLGVGSDIGGSLRCPAHFCGVSTLKPTSKRMSLQGQSSELPETSAILPTWGPLARSVDDVVLMLRALWDGTMSEDDPNLPNLLFSEKEYSKTDKLRVGYFLDNGLFAATPACKRAVVMAVDKLRELGHEVVQWTPPEFEKAEFLEYQLLGADGGEVTEEVLRNDIRDECLTLGLDYNWVPRWMKGVVAFLISFFDEREATKIKLLMGCKDVKSYWEAERELEEYVHSVSKSWKDEQLDVVISPPFPFPALPHGTTQTSLAGASYTMIYNVLDFPAGVVRMTKVNEEDVEKMAGYPETDEFHKTVKECAKSTVGLPVGVQVAALRWKEELCLRAMKEVEKAMDY